MLRLAFDFIITWRETRTRPNAYHATTVVHYPIVKKVNMFLKTQVKNAYSLIRPKEILSLFIN